MAPLGKRKEVGEGGGSEGMVGVVVQVRMALGVGLSVCTKTSDNELP